MHYVKAKQVHRLAPAMLAYIRRELAAGHRSVEILMPTGAKLYGVNFEGRARYHVSGYSGKDALDMVDALGCADPLARLRALGYTSTFWILVWRNLSINELSTMVDDLVEIPSTADGWWNDRVMLVLDQLRKKHYPVGSPAHLRVCKLVARVQEITRQAANTY